MHYEINDDPFIMFVADRNGKYTEARFMALADQMHREGRNKNRVLFSMMNAAFALASGQKSAGDYLAFLVWLRDHAEEARAGFAAVLENTLAEDRERECARLNGDHRS